MVLCREEANAITILCYQKQANAIKTINTIISQQQQQTKKQNKKWGEGGGPFAKAFNTLARTNCVIFSSDK